MPSDRNRLQSVKMSKIHDFQALIGWALGSNLFNLGSLDSTSNTLVPRSY